MESTLELREELKHIADLLRGLGVEAGLDRLEEYGLNIRVPANTVAFSISDLNDEFRLHIGDRVVIRYVIPMRQVVIAVRPGYYTFEYTLHEAKLSAGVINGYVDVSIKGDHFHFRIVEETIRP